MSDKILKEYKSRCDWTEENYQTHKSDLGGEEENQF